MSSTPTNSLSVELLVFSFCFVEAVMGNCLPIDKPPPVWPCIFGCTANKALTYHINSPSFSAPKTRGWALSFLKYSMRWRSFSHSSLLGALTLIDRNAINRHTSGLALLVRQCLCNNGVEVY